MKFRVVATASLLGIITIGELIAPAAAADMPIMGPPLVQNGWAGCYIGANAGYARTLGKSVYQDPNRTGDPINGLSGLFGTQTYIPTPSETGASGVTGGGDVGCNWQNRQWIYGIEGDFDAAGIASSQSTTGPLGSYLPGKASITLSDFLGTANEQVSLPWLSTFRARVGFAIQDRLLLFATGGIAIGEVTSQGSVNLINGAFFETWSGLNTTINTGYVLGGGAEWALSDHWDAKMEYLWYDLGQVSHPLNCTTGNLGGAPCNSFIYPTLGNTLSQVDGSIIRIGVDYKFGGPVVGRH